MILKFQQQMTQFLHSAAWSCHVDVSSVHGSFTELQRPVIIRHKASQSILISHLLLIAIQCTECRGQANSTQTKGDMTKGEKHQRDTQGGDLITEKRNKKAKCHSSMVKSHSSALIKMGHFPATVQTMKLAFTRSQITLLKKQPRRPISHINSIFLLNLTYTFIYIV